MIYINDSKQPYYTYDDTVDLAIKAGINAKRAYIYLAGLGVRGSLARVQSTTSLDYSRPVKVAVKGNKLVTKIGVCDKCKSLTIFT